MDNKKLLLYGGIAAVVIVLLYLFKQNQANNLASLNQPGLLTQGSYPATPSTALGSILSGAAGGVSSFLSGDAFDGSNSDLNDPGLDYQDETSFAGMNYTYANSNSYAPAPSDPSYSSGTTDFSI